MTTSVHTVVEIGGRACMHVQDMEQLDYCHLNVTEQAYSTTSGHRNYGTKIHSCTSQEL